MLTVFNQVSVLFILLIVGFSIKKLKIIDDTLNKGLTNFILYVALPSLTVASMNIDFSKSMFINGGLLLIGGICVSTLSLIVSIFVPRLLKVDDGSIGVYRFCTIFPNYGFMGYPVAYALYGSTGVFYAVIYNLPLTVLMWTVGVMIIGKGDKNRIEYRNLLNPGIVAAIAGIFIFLFSVKIPLPLARSLQLLGDTTTPLVMITMGSILANIEIKTIFKDIRLLGISVMRLVFLPLSVWTVLGLLGLDNMLIAIPVVITAMPAAANTGIFAEKFGGDTQTAAKIVFISTALSMVTIPLIVSLI